MEQIGWPIFRAWVAQNTAGGPRRNSTASVQGTRDDFSARRKDTCDGGEWSRARRWEARDDGQPATPKKRGRGLACLTGVSCGWRGKLEVRRAIRQASRRPLANSSAARKPLLRTPLIDRCEQGRRCGLVMPQLPLSWPAACAHAWWSKPTPAYSTVVPLAARPTGR